MCGIAGFVAKRGSAIPDTARVALASLAHRGPDGSGQFQNDSALLLHTRLSIIDLEQGAQPLYDREQRFALVANGEIYNHVELRKELEAQGADFLTHSDCEVILHGYKLQGDRFFEKLEGMFAFALVDTAENTVFLGRDTMGMKPLYIRETDHGIFFGSEIKVLQALGSGSSELDPVAIAQYLQDQHALGDRTPFADIKRHPQGVVRKYVNGELEGELSLWSFDALNQVPAKDAVEKLDALMAEVFKQHLRSDVPIGLFLSGGVDSTILLGLMHRYGGEQVEAFTLGFPGSSVGDELDVASLLADHYGCRHHIIRPEPAQMLNRLVHTTWAADDLMRDPANLPTAMLAEDAGKTMKVVFSGEGGDEAFAGYGRYRPGKIEALLKSWVFPGSGGFRAQGDFRGGEASGLFGSRLIEGNKRWRQDIIDLWSSTPTHWSALQKRQSIDLRESLPDNLLVKADRMLMAYGVEGRLPFVDRRIAAFGLMLPDDLKVGSGAGKQILKRWASSFMPATHFDLPKRGFKVPINDWMRGDYLDRCERVLLSDTAVNTWFNTAGVVALFKRQRQRHDRARHIFAILQFAIWHRLFVATQTVSAPSAIDPLDFLEGRG